VFSELNNILIIKICSNQLNFVVANSIKQTSIDNAYFHFRLVSMLVLWEQNCIISTIWPVICLCIMFKKVGGM